MDPELDVCIFYAVASWFGGTGTLMDVVGSLLVSVGLSLWGTGAGGGAVSVMGRGQV